MIQWGSPYTGDGTTPSSADTWGNVIDQDDDLLASAILDGVKRMLLRLADAQERLVTVEASTDEEVCLEAVEGYLTTAHVLREVAAALGTTPVAA